MQLAGSACATSSDIRMFMIDLLKLEVHDRKMSNSEASGNHGSDGAQAQNEARQRGIQEAAYASATPVGLRPPSVADAFMNPVTSHSAPVSVLTNLTTSGNLQ